MRSAYDAIAPSGACTVGVILRMKSVCEMGGGPCSHIQRLRVVNVADILFSCRRVCLFVKLSTGHVLM